jgi:hypothetical protein
MFTSKDCETSYKVFGEWISGPEYGSVRTIPKVRFARDQSLGSR